MKSHVIYPENSTAIVNSQPDIIRQPITSQPSVNSMCISHPWVYSACGSVAVDGPRCQEAVHVSPGVKPRLVSKTADSTSISTYNGSRFWSKDLFDSFTELHRSKRKCSALISRSKYVSLFVWFLSLELSDMGDPTSNCATVGIALGVFGTLKPLYLAKVETRQRVCGECCRVPCMMANVANSLGDKRYLPFIPGTGAAIRFKVRILRGIQGTIGQDCLVTSCCCPCATCQMYREIEDFGFGAGW